MCVVVRTGLEKPFEPADAKECAFVCAATVAIVDKVRLKYGINAVEYPVMHYPVAKVRGEDFALDWLVHQKAGFGRERVALFYDGQGELCEFGFLVAFKFAGTRGLALVAARLMVGQKEFGE